ncbi:phosphotransferase enzyme family protein [Deinococcus arcticus]|uniref:Aminoglycoside phosphotransferase domain-containing protein n=1 Tax=Deinococcus arcticus TaxID=2136176 RepID=A0A2T3W8G3_9DEIO|nr:phosphotransferase [Deinococcus arcticus]PTA68162.1 hypothetical protein C8263_08805 [Deinococcus arcticus]
MNPGAPPTPADLAPHWPLGAGAQLQALAGGSINGAYRVQAPQGSFHLRLYRDPRPERALREHCAIEVARAAGVPTPAPLPTRQGGPLAQLPQGWAALFEVAPGQPVPRHALTPAHAAALGTFLAQLHEQLPVSVPFEVPALAAPAAVALTIERLDAVRAAIEARPAPDEVDRWALARTRQRLAHLHTGPRLDTVPNLPSRFVHGDYHDGNVFFREQQPVALTDWEQTRLAPRAWEVVRTLHLSLGLSATLCRPFLAGYRTRLALPGDELQAGADLYATLQERNVWTFETVYLKGNPGPRRFIRPPPYVPFEVAWARAGLR